MRQLMVFLAVGGVLGVLVVPLLGGPGCATPGHGPPGTGDGSSADDGETCAAEVPVEVMANVVTPVSVVLVCTPQAGNAHVVATFDCPQIVSVTAAPTVTSVGGKVQLHSEVSASDAAVTSYRWTASSGTVVDSTAAQTSFVCGRAGAVTLTLTTTRSSCTDHVAVGVTCVGMQP